MKHQSLLLVRSLCRNRAGGTYLVGQLLQQMGTHRVSTRVQFAGPPVLIGWTTSLHMSSIRLCSLVIQWSRNVCLGVQLADLVPFTLEGGGLSPRRLGFKYFLTRSWPGFYFILFFQNSSSRFTGEDPQH